MTLGRLKGRDSEPFVTESLRELLPEVFADSVVVVVGDDGDVEVVAGGDVGDAGGDGRVECVGTEEADGSVAGLGGDEGVGAADGLSYLPYPGLGSSARVWT